MSRVTESKERYVPNEDRSRPLEVICPGLPRTGTKSVAIALERLGFRHCAHGFDVLDNPGQFFGTLVPCGTHAQFDIELTHSRLYANT